jgi:membrane protease YdiL (CAAX protease family)
MPTLFDAVVVALLVLVVPIGAVIELRRLERDVASGKLDARLRMYRSTMRWQWGTAALLLAGWVAAGRSLAHLGIEWPRGWRFWACAALALVVIAALLAQRRAAERRPEFAARVRDAAGPITFMLPASPNELRLFTWLGITAGIVEELVYRGYVMWVLGAVAPTWVALVGSSLAFGAGHAYQGVTGVAKTAAVGLVAGGVYLFSGSIWIPMLLHAAIDVVNGQMVYIALKSGSDSRDS